jgi:predicted histidine transporter YuiF (NhaC family)
MIPFSPPPAIETSRFVIKFFLIAGTLFVAFGFGQFFLQMGLDALGVIEVGNALGLGLLLYLTVSIGALLLIFGSVIALVRFLSRPKESEA